MFIKRYFIHLTYFTIDHKQLPTSQIGTIIGNVFLNKRWYETAYNFDYFFNNKGELLKDQFVIARTDLLYLHFNNTNILGVK
jgi:hypothetical protein